MFCLRIYDFLKFCAVHLSEPVLEPNRTGRTGSKLFCSGSGSVLANKLRFWFSVLKKWSENWTEPNFSNTKIPRSHSPSLLLLPAYVQVHHHHQLSTIASNYHGISNRLGLHCPRGHRAAEVR